MRLCRLEGKRYGLVRDSVICDITSIVQENTIEIETGDSVFASLPKIVAAVEQSIGTLAEICAVEDGRFLSPVAHPTKLVAAPVNYEAHILEANADPEITFNNAVLRIETAGLFLKANSSLVGAGEGIALRFPDRRTDHEIELALIIGSECRDVSEDDALAHVAGYTIGLDMSVRGKEDRSFRKSIDSYSVLGPWLVTADEFGSPDDVGFALLVNGEQRQASSTKHLIFGVRKLIAWASSWYTLYPGDVIFTGTPEGVGPVAPGDTLRCTMDNIGTMEVSVREATRSASAV